MALKKLAPRQLDLGQVSGFEIIPESPVGNQVEVAAGNYLDFVTLTIKFVPALTSPAFTVVAPGTERWDLLYVAPGAVLLSKAIGTPQALFGPAYVGVPAVPLGALPLAYIHVDEVGAVLVDDADITDVRSLFNQPSHRNLSGTVTIFHDSAQSNHTKAVPANWNVVTNPQTEKILLDELASRVKFQETSKTFLSLTDTFVSYAGRALQFLRVNAGQTAIETVAIAGLPNVQYGNVQSYLELDANAGGIQTSSVIIATPLSFGSSLPPHRITFSMHVYAGDDITVPPVQYIIDIDVRRDYDPLGGTLAWLCSLKNSFGFALAVDFVTGTYAPQTTSMTLPNAHLYVNGPWFKASLSTPIGTPLMAEVARMKHLASATQNPNLSLSWNAGLAQLTVQLSSDLRAVAMTIVCEYAWNSA